MMRPGPTRIHPHTYSQFHLHDDSAQSVLTYAVEHLGVEHGALLLPPPHLVLRFLICSYLPVFIYLNVAWVSDAGRSPCMTQLLSSGTPNAVVSRVHMIWPVLLLGRRAMLLHKVSLTSRYHSTQPSSTSGMLLLLSSFRHPHPDSKLLFSVLH